MRFFRRLESIVFEAEDHEEAGFDSRFFIPSRPPIHQAEEFLLHYLVLVKVYNSVSWLTQAFDNQLNQPVDIPDYTTTSAMTAHDYRPQ